MTQGIFDSGFRQRPIFDNSFLQAPIFDSGIPPSAYINSVQDFEIILGPGISEASATISTVDLSRSWIEIGFWEVSGSTDVYSDAVALYSLSDPNTVTIDRDPINGLNNTIIARGRVINAKPALVVNVQYVQAVIAASVTTGSVIVGTVSLANTMLSYEGVYHDGPYPWATQGAAGAIDFQLSDAVTVAVSRTTADANSSVLGAFVVSFNPSVISSVQAVQINLNTTPLDVTISALSNINNAILAYNGAVINGGGIDQSMWGGFILNTTTARLVRAVVGSKMFARFQVIEFATGVLKSTVQQILMTIIPGSNQQNTSFTAVLQDRSFLKWCGLYSNAGAYRYSSSAVKMDAIANNVVSDRTANTMGATNTTSAYTQVVEFN